MKRTIAIIGAGNMGNAFIQGLKRTLPEITLHICDRHPEKVKNLTDVKIFADASEAIGSTDAVLLAVKPQSAGELLKSLAPALERTLVLSIMAGITIQKIGEWTGSVRIIRAMPNLPAKVGLGLTGWIASKECSNADRDFAGKLFASVGEQMELKDERMMDALTALSGSGPAYFFLLAELLAAKAEREGFTKEQASMLAKQTFVGSAMLLHQDARGPLEWRTAVTSKGGTTEAALQSFQGNDLERIVSGAIDAAIARSRELNR